MNVFAPIATWGFWPLLAAGWWLGTLQVKGAVAFVVLWLAGYAGSRFVLHGTLFLPYVAVLDIALVLVVFEGDVRLK